MNRKKYRNSTAKAIHCRKIPKIFSILRFNEGPLKGPPRKLIVLKKKSGALSNSCRMYKREREREREKERDREREREKRER